MKVLLREVNILGEVGSFEKINRRNYIRRKEDGNK